MSKFPALRRTTQPEHYLDVPEWLVRLRWHTAMENQPHKRDQQHGRGEELPLNLVRDVASLDQGGELIPLDEFLAEVTRQPKAPGLGEWIQRQMMAYGLVQHADLSNVTAGNTPSERAANYVIAAMIAASQQGLAKARGDFPEPAPGNATEGETGKNDGMPNLSGQQAGKEQAEALNEAFEKIAQMTPQERMEAMAADDVADDKKEEKPCNNYGTTAGKGPSDSTLTIVRLAALQLNSRVLDIADRVGRNLDLRVETSVVPDISIRDDPDGREINVRPIAGPHEIPLMQPSDKVMLVQNPQYAAMRITQSEATVLPRATKLTRKQFVLMCVDRSGSMNAYEHIRPFRAALALVNNRVAHALKGEVELHLKWWASDVMSGAHIIDETNAHQWTPAKVALSWKGARVGTGTNVGIALRSCLMYIQEHFGEDAHAPIPDLMFVSDGEDRIEHWMIDPKQYQLADGRQIRLNHFGITDHLPIKFDPDTMRRHMSLLEQGEFQSAELRELYASDFNYALALIARLTGGSAWFIHPDTGDLLDPKEIYQKPTADVTHNPYTAMGVGQTRWTRPTWTSPKGGFPWQKKG